MPVFANEALRDGASGDRTPMSATVRAGIPTDVLLNLDLYTYGLGLDGGLGFQVTPRLIAGGIIGYGYGAGSADAVPDHQHYVFAAARIGFGGLSAFSGSLLLGAVYIPLGDRPAIPNFGISLDYRLFSVGLTTAAVSAGVNLSI